MTCQLDGEAERQSSQVEFPAWLTMREPFRVDGSGDAQLRNSSISSYAEVESLLKLQSSWNESITLMNVYRAACLIYIITTLIARFIRFRDPRSMPCLPVQSHSTLRSILGPLRSVSKFLKSALALISPPTDPLNLIPGPWCVPLIGSLAFFLRGNWFQSMSDLRQKYGDVYRLQIGSRPIVVLCGRRAVEAALVGKQSRVFAGRPALHSFRLASEGKSMSFNGYSEEWRAHRRLAERVARAMYANKTFVEDCLSVEAQNLRDLFLVQAERGGGATPYDPDVDLLWSVAHVQYSLCYGNSHEDDSFHDMVRNTIQLIGCHNSGNAVDFFPWARHLLRFQVEAMERICDRMLSITREKHRQHQRSFTRGRIRDILDALLEFGVKGEKSLEEEEKVVMTVQEFIGAGLDIVHAALHWTILYAARQEADRRKIQEEIREVIGAERTPTRDDMHRMPFTVAFIAEVFRHSSVVPLALPHSTTSDAYLDGHFLPANTFVLVNLQSVNHDANAWPKPEIFQPERFLETQPGGTLRFRGGDTAFGFGWRRCVGAELSRLEIFLYLTTLLQSCEICLAPSSMERDLDEARLGIVLRPKPFSVIVTRR